MVSVILTCWRRFKNFEAIIKAWLEQPEVSEVIIWDNSGTFKTSLPVLLLNSSENVNPSARYMISGLAKNDVIVNADDDVMPLPGLIADFLPYFRHDRFLGMSGFVFLGNSFSNHKTIRSREITKAQGVHTVAACISMSPKNLLGGYDYLSFPIHQLEIYLQCLFPPGITRIVPPSVRYQVLDEMDDENALYRQPKTREVCKVIYEKYYHGRHHDIGQIKLI